MIKVKIIKKIDKKDYPNWLNERETRSAYILTINDNKCYIYWCSTEDNMLYVDGFYNGFINNSYIKGWDVRSSLTNNNEYISLFGKDMWEVDDAIDRAIKHFELVNGLQGDAKDTWSDILEFKQIVLEALKGLDIKVLGVAEDGWGMKYSDSIMYNVNINNVPTTVEYIPGGSGIDGDWLNIKLVNGKSWGDAGNLYRLLNLNDDLTLQELTNSLEKAIKLFPLISGLKGDAKDTWEDILS
jgi:hypothetical protein